MGKGDKRRLDQTTKEEQNLRDRYARHKITFIQYEKEYRELMKQGLIKRSGKVIKDVDSSAANN
ncbi:hypothetical protein LCGC14_2288320 [marine sediment metagenome]|uniref:Uncharacterized protein n=1 Tax=marine sediment metagenome TaxID=412755 RepID=A0A0F9CRU4_9ZZZZ